MSTREKALRALAAIEQAAKETVEDGVAFAFDDEFATLRSYLEGMESQGEHRWDEDECEACGLHRYCCEPVQVRTVSRPIEKERG